MPSRCDPWCVCVCVVWYSHLPFLRRETNLKQRKVPPVTAGKTKEELTDLSGVLKCEKPNHILYSFKGTTPTLLVLPPPNIMNSSRPRKPRLRPAFPACVCYVAPAGTLEIEGEDAAPLDKQNLLLQVRVLSSSCVMVTCPRSFLTCFDHPNHHSTT